ncbi:MAG: ABC transporter permease [Firmicutes bacterium]|nr:ABC transporter permease [Bacillota bacterium]
MKSELKGFNKIFSFTFLQHIKGKAYKTTTLAIALALFLIPVAIFVGIEVFGGSDETGEIDAVPVDMTTIERLYIVDDTDDGRADMSALPIILQGTGINTQVKDFGNDFDKAKLATEKDKNALILYTHKDGELYTTDIIIPDKSEISEDAAYTFQIYLDQYLYALDMTYNGYIPDEEPATDDEEVYVDEEETEEEENLSLAFMIVSYLNVMILYFFVLAYGQSVANSVVMEKSSKLMETFLISVKPMAMIMGKLMAITFAGIIQFVSWVASLILGILAGVGLVNIINPDAQLTVVSSFEIIRELTAGMFSPVNCFLALMMIVVGLLLYCSLAGIGGALAGKSEDLASTNVIFTMVLVISFLVCIYTGTLNGDMDAAPWLDWIPFTAVMITPAKALLGTVSVCRSLASFGIIAVTTLAVTFIAGKLYKMMVLYKGEPLKPAAILKMLKNK